VAQVDTDDLPYAEVVRGQWAYVFNQCGGEMQMIDVSIPARATIVASTPITNPSDDGTPANQAFGPQCFAVAQGRYLYVITTGPERLRIFDLEPQPWRMPSADSVPPQVPAIQFETHRITR
jgi:hypothetical protein